MTSGVLAATPLRLSLGGGGTDLPSYARVHGGLVVGFAIDRVVSVAAHPRMFGGGVRACLERTETAPTAAGLSDPFTRAALAAHGVDSGVQIASFGDAPPGSGLGGSAAYTVSLLHALHRLGAPHGAVDAGLLAERAAAVEMERLGRPVGKQDHYLAALGGAHVLRVGTDLGVTAEPLKPAPEVVGYIADRLLLFHTGRTRDAGGVLAAQAGRTDAGDRATVRALHAIREVADAMTAAFTAGDTERIGPLLDAHWRHKRALSPAVTTPEIDRLYSAGTAAGADGGKLLGAGGGGFLLLSSRPGRQADIRATMTALGAAELPFAYSPAGTRSLALGA
ncbi:hypothetical protein LG943_05570 [Streptomonospora sp. S1-112]|uniref:D-glycero-alpha-D-manno-heptose 7-phosphate kinase n=1 Tax=Streptomonospora mangrovi TaxID=2883123 RepID=A0A9X3NIG9_9ACTN|nr:hypothetical protein [Streptomonospora mangrovi]MDA0563798.1 hypothetical protein [Streptomonospora mangrovi]